MVNKQNPNQAQDEAIHTTEGPVLLIAGPGTGKTYTLVERTVYLIQEKHVEPDEIFIATFTEKAAKELTTRITNALASHNISANLNEMYVGTFHSICLRILKENLANTRIRKNFRVLDQFDQQYIVYQNIWPFQKIQNYSSVINQKNLWKQAEKICYYANTLSEELVMYEDLQKDSDIEIVAIGDILEKYFKILNEGNYLDFSGIQVETYNLLINYPGILAELQNKIKYIMVDEYQDTNYIQEQLVFLIAGTRQNICVVGDDDQGLYRFRGATIRNILEFPQKFPDGKCKQIKLITNYRSTPDIVSFYNTWMHTTFGSSFKFSWEGKYRFDKDIIAGKTSECQSATVIRVTGDDEEAEVWHKELLLFIQKLKASGTLSDYNQIAFLFKSVKSDRVKNLADFFEKHGIGVYSPRSDMFFDRLEVKQVIGSMILLFAKCYSDITGLMDPKKLNFFKSLCKYYEACILEATKLLNDNADLKSWFQQKIIEISGIQQKLEYKFSSLFYQLVSFSPFREILDSSLSGGVTDLRPQRNLALISQILNKYEYLHNLDIFTINNISKNVYNLFFVYLKLLLDGGISEYEDETEYAPSGCISFMTIHQSKGMEFPIVIVGIENSAPKKQNDDLIDKIGKYYFKREEFEPPESIKFFDFWRLYYTAYSRAQNLLVLTTRSKDGKGKQPSKYFSDMYYDIPEWTSSKFVMSDICLENIKEINLKQTYAFTSHILFYERCPTQYKFFKELEFTPSRIGSTLFGTLVHQTIEDVHRAAIRGEADSITEENVRSWLYNNYDGISLREHSYLVQRQIDAAAEQVLSYVKHETSVHPDWSHIKESEVDVSIVKENYILEGKIDLITRTDGIVDIIDFKSEKKPNLVEEKERMELYKKQLQIYAHLVEERTGNKVGSMKLYYTGEENSNPVVTFERDQVSIDETVKEFGKIVAKIQAKDFYGKSTSYSQCRGCDMRYYCRKVGM